MLEKKRPILDFPTFMVIAAMVVGFPFLLLAHAEGSLPWWMTMVLGTMLMNLSFTAWHESSHGNFSRFGWVNTVSGIVASLASVYPGYFARRREHLIHHRWEGDPTKDPVYARIQTRFWMFPFQLMRVNFREQAVEDPKWFCPVTKAQRIVDLMTMFSAVGLVVVGFKMGLGWSVMWAWLVPRGLVFFLHAYTICFFPHQIAGGGYQTYRVRTGGLWLRWLTVDQMYHGIHHRWPHLPWHKYRTFFELNRDQLPREGIEILTTSPAQPIGVNP